MSNEEKVRFEIDQLRKDKIIYAIESVATSAVGILVVLLLPSFPIPSGVEDTLKTLILSVVTGYWIYMGIGNFQRLSKIKKLEKSLNL
jgi:hypothetical protein